MPIKTLGTSLLRIRSCWVNTDREVLAQGITGSAEKLPNGLLDLFGLLLATSSFVSGVDFPEAALKWLFWFNCCHLIKQYIADTCPLCTIISPRGLTA